MLIIMSDVHLGDGTCGASISASAFRLLAERIRELAYHASFRADGSYRPLESIDLLLLGDILEVQHSTRWLAPGPGGEHVRPWTDWSHPAYAAVLSDITEGILRANPEATDILRGLAQGEIVRLQPADSRGRPAGMAAEPLPVPVRIHYMVGNHDWQYCLPGPAFDAIRARVIAALGLANTPDPFPHAADDSPALLDLFARYKVYARHGDIYDRFNYDPRCGRRCAALGDALAVEMLNRFPLEVQKELGSLVPPALIDNLRHLTNIRPVLAAPLWISSQIRQFCGNPAMEDRVKAIWDRMGQEFLALDFVRSHDRPLLPDVVDALQAILSLTRRASFSTVNDVVVWVRQKMWESDDVSFARKALTEDSFLNRRVNYIVYGHTHKYEIVPLDAEASTTTPYLTSQIYFNSGTWHPYYDLTVYRPHEQKFIPYQVLTYLVFYRDGERGGRGFETWSGAFS